MYFSWSSRVRKSVVTTLEYIHQGPLCQARQCDVVDVALRNVIVNAWYRLVTSGVDRVAVFDILRATDSAHGTVRRCKR